MSNLARICLGIICAWPIAAQTSDETVTRLLNRLEADEARIRELEQKLALLTGMPPAAPSPVAPAPPPVVQAASAHDHEMGAGGPNLVIRGFADFNLGFGQAANPLIFPLGATTKSTFQTGEFDLFLSSRLSDKIRFLSEIVLGTDATNVWGLDIERLEVIYRPTPYFQISGGRFHTSIGYYNTTFHHGTWLQTATGRPFMYYFEDSGGLLPVHSVGVSTEGDVPGTEKIGLHWIAEIGNGRSSDPNAQPVQNFTSDKNHKAFNVAAYVRPQTVPGLQVGGSYYRDLMVPAGNFPVTQQISSGYAVYTRGKWEFLNEAVLMKNTVAATGRVYQTPLMYSQLAHRFGRYQPYFRYQYINSPSDDPINVFTGRYQGPSPGLRMDFTDYVALKFQYNRIYQRSLPQLNGFDLQMAFTF